MTFGTWRLPERAAQQVLGRWRCRSPRAGGTCRGAVLLGPPETVSEEVAPASEEGTLAEIAKEPALEEESYNPGAAPRGRPYKALLPTTSYEDYLTRNSRKTRSILRCSKR